RLRIAERIGAPESLFLSERLQDGVDHLHRRRHGSTAPSNRRARSGVGSARRDRTHPLFPTLALARRQRSRALETGSGAFRAWRYATLDSISGTPYAVLPQWVGVA